MGRLEAMLALAQALLDLGDSAHARRRSSMTRRMC